MVRQSIFHTSFLDEISLFFALPFSDSLEHNLEQIICPPGLPQSAHANTRSNEIFLLLWGFEGIMEDVKLTKMY